MVGRRVLAQPGQPLTLTVIDLALDNSRIVVS